jgi:hypothetical protein
MGSFLCDWQGRVVKVYLTPREAAESLAGPAPVATLDRDSGDAWRGRYWLQEAHAAGRMTLTARPRLSNGRLGPRQALPRDFFEDGGLDLGDNSAGPDAQGSFERLDKGRDLPRWEDVRAFASEVAAEVAARGGVPVLGGAQHPPPPWWPWPQDKLKQWGQREAVVAEAERRVSVRHKGKMTLNGALRTMAEEAGMDWSQKSIAQTLRRLKQVPRPNRPPDSPVGKP